MKAYFDDGQIQIYHGDCREILPSLEPVDLVLTDPPYEVGMRAFTDDLAVGIEGLALAKSKLAAVFMSPARVIRFANGVAPAWSFERLLWMEKVADLSFPWRGWLMNSEAIMIFSREGAVWPTPEVYSRDCYHVAPWGKQGHPNAKPPRVVKDILLKLCKDTVLDFCMGSGTTLRAAKDLGRRAIGIEIEERYCELAARRMGQEVFDFEATA